LCQKKKHNKAMNKARQYESTPMSSQFDLRCQTLSPKHESRRLGAVSIVLGEGPGQRRRSVTRRVSLVSQVATRLRQELAESGTCSSTDEDCELSWTMDDGNSQPAVAAPGRTKGDATSRPMASP
jgi:hypothetical protein